MLRLRQLPVVRGLRRRGVRGRAGLGGAREGARASGARRRAAGGADAARLRSRVLHGDAEAPARRRPRVLPARRGAHPPHAAPPADLSELLLPAAAVADGKPATIVDYVPVYASPIGAGFAYWPEV